MINHSLSRDGSRILFHVIESSAQQSFSEAGKLYVRDDQGTSITSDDITTFVSASQKNNGTGPGGTDPAGPLPAIFLDAEPEHGSKVLFASCEQLTNDSTAGGGPGCSNGEHLLSTEPRPGRELYRYDLDSGDLIDLTSADPSGGDFFGLVGASDDLTKVYFVAGGLLDPGSAAIVGRPNLYLWDSGSISYIATLNGQDAEGGSGQPIDYYNWSNSAGDAFQSTRITADGRYLAFTSREPLTLYNNTNSTKCPPFGALSNPNGRCAEVYLYDAEADEGEGTITCISCASLGSLPSGDASLGRHAYCCTGITPLPFNLSEDGNRVFFQTYDPLVRTDSNGKQDVYEWEDGQTHLISAGSGNADSFFADATPSGGDVFFTTRDSLVSSDGDAEADLYDARSGGGFPEPPPGSPPCEGDACQPPPIVPNDPTPSSASFVGPESQRLTRTKGRGRHHKKRGRHHKKKRGQRHKIRRGGSHQGGSPRNKVRESQTRNHRRGKHLTPRRG
ncbi:MAG TPA: hypothetical protein VG898_08835 [Solirubrobacterales bacterium]|nr:hypothetical protein [Solirubrobacterales bacterium]